VELVGSVAGSSAVGVGLDCRHLVGYSSKLLMTGRRDELVAELVAEMPVF
jgi:hypothetical protein